MAIPTRPVLMPLIIVFITTLIISAYSCSGNNATEQVPPSSTADSFTFFDLGSNSLLTDQIRKNLENQLGSEAIEGRSTIDLSIHFSDFLETHFQRLENLNKKLNWPPKDRVEHNITKLMYRYADKKKLPFSYIELFFSNYTGNPLFFRIYADSQGAPMVTTLVKKYGPAQTIQWRKKNRKTLYWKKQEDILTASSTQDRLGRAQYLFCIFFVSNLEHLLQREKEERKVQKEKIEDAGKAVF